MKFENSGDFAESFSPFVFLRNEIHCEEPFTHYVMRLFPTVSPLLIELRR